MYKVIIKYCVFFQEFSIFCHLSLASTGLLLGCSKNSQPIRVTVHSDPISDELIFYLQGMGFSGLGQHAIFNKHPVDAAGP